jgi:hypothetical protein
MFWASLKLQLNSFLRIKAIKNLSFLIALENIVTLQSKWMAILGILAEKIKRRRYHHYYTNP